MHDCRQRCLDLMVFSNLSDFMKKLGKYREVTSQTLICLDSYSHMVQILIRAVFVKEMANKALEILCLC